MKVLELVPDDDVVATVQRRFIEKRVPVPKAAAPKPKQRRVETVVPYLLHESETSKSTMARVRRRADRRDAREPVETSVVARRVVTQRSRPREPLTQRGLKLYGLAPSIAQNGGEQVMRVAHRIGQRERRRHEARFERSRSLDALVDAMGGNKAARGFSRRTIPVVRREIDAIKHILLREQCLRALRDVTVRRPTKTEAPAPADDSSTQTATAPHEEAAMLVGELRRASIDVVEAVCRWRDCVRRSARHIGFVWDGSNYLCTMFDDVCFLDATNALDIRAFDNPLLLPAHDLSPEDRDRAIRANSELRRELEAERREISRAPAPLPGLRVFLTEPLDHRSGHVLSSRTMPRLRAPNKAGLDAHLDESRVLAPRLCVLSRSTSSLRGVFADVRRGSG